ncbi:MAG: hypothetical protein FWE91_02515 [Defluviitaleaceae bacterium]|nr:hypothetical protein [Defluviitaleaceae bacterium]MCL2835595.1 hypothetical protein [Defluviitaleaceae bacterium]
MVTISEIIIISIDKSEESWAIEGEILFESDLSTPFSATYYPEDDEFEELEIEITPGRFDKFQMKQMILRAAQEYED